MNDPSPQPSPAFDLETLAAHVLGESEPAVASRIDAAAATAPDLRRSLSRLRTLVETLRTDDSVLPRRELVDRVKDVLRPTPRPSLAEWLAQLGHSAAALVFDSHAELALAGFRGAAPAAQQLAFSSEVAEVDLQLSPPDTSPRNAGAPALWSLRGQVSSPDPDGPVPHAAVALIDQARQQLISAETDDRGMFTLTAPAGRYDLIVKTAAGAVTLPAINLR